MQNYSKTTSANLPTKHGEFKVAVYKFTADNLEHVVLSIGDLKEPVLTRVHSKCLTGESFFSLKCDCGDQLDKSMELISREKNGLILYLDQEGRGIGLANKIEAYALQDDGLDTVEANERLGFKADNRDYQAAAEMLKDLGIKKIKLLTNNPDKEKQIAEYGIEVSEVLPLEIKPNEINKSYLETKKQKMGHRLKLES